MILRPYSFAGRLLNNDQVSAGFQLGIAAGPTRNAIAVRRANASPVIAGVSQDVRTIPIEFTVNPGVEVAQGLMTILAAVQPNSATPRTLIATIGPENASPSDWAMYGELLEIEAWTGQYRYTGRNGVIVDFFVADDLWRERIDTEIPAARFDASNQGMALVNGGGAPVAPVIKLSEITARTGSTDELGWLYKRTATITNNSARDWRRVRFTLDLGDTSAWVTATKSLASGDDIRIIVGETEVNRTLTNVNTKRTLAHFVATVPAGQSITVEVWYGNPNATTPASLSDRNGADDDYVADDLEGVSGTASSGTGTTLVDSIGTQESDRWNEGFIQIVGGTGSGQRRRISDFAYSAGTSTFTVPRAWTTNPDNTSVYVVWRTGIAVDGGAASAGSTTTLTDASQAWYTDQWKGGSLYNVTKGIGPFSITGNSATVLTISGTMTAPSASDVYYVERSGFLQWHVDDSVFETDHRGMWRANKYFNKGALIRYGDLTPGGWMPWLMLPNQDDFAQGRYVNEGSGGGHAINNWPVLYARRAVRSDNTWPEEGQADGVAFYDPRGLHGFDWNYRMKNEGGSSTGIGTVEVRTQDAMGNDWETVASDSTYRSALNAVTSSGATGYASIEGAVRIWLGVLPTDGVAIPSSARKDHSIELRPHERMKIWLDLNDWGGLTGSVYTVSSESAGWDVNTRLRLGGGSDIDPPYDTVEIGGAGHKLMITSGQELWINLDPTPEHPLFGIYASDILVRRVPFAGEVYRYERDLDGSAAAIISPSQFMPIGFGENLLAGLLAADWTKTDGAGVTSALTDVTTPEYDDDDHALRVNVSAAPVGPWTIELESAPIDLIPGQLYEFSLAAYRSGLTSAVNVEMKAVYLANGASATGNTDQPVDRDLAANTTWYPMAGGNTMFAGSPVSDATDGVIILITISGDGATTGSVYLDQIIFGTIPNLYVFESNMGTIAVEPTWRERWFA